jgi:hypothetical protein
LLDAIQITVMGNSFPKSRAEDIGCSNRILDSEIDNSDVSKGGRMAGNRQSDRLPPFPGREACSIVISGTEDDVLDLAILHAKTVQGHEDTPELREQIRSMLQDEDAATAEAA